MAPGQSMKSLILPSRTILVQKLPPVTKPFFRIIMNSREFNPSVWNANTGYGGWMIALFPHYKMDSISSRVKIREHNRKTHYFSIVDYKILKVIVNILDLDY
ncbi:hypothetical protein Glove_229g87 [Diversispora epigaea]|uniref:Uncharacterized protein n=1 Tax=Diversispora epigaea TaxID=1348612 RepID=A0A397ICX7_9GLOM|nr:hypothetical protein Glove_229g87 [Diversispora epigaea]